MEIEAGKPESAAPVSAVLDGLNDLLQLDHDAIAAYEIAIERVENPDWVDQIAGFMLDHERHVRQLNEVILELGGTPRNEPHITGPFKEALQSLGALGGDRGLLVAFRANELQARRKYDRYASKANRWPPNVKLVVDANALDEERHYRWASEVLDGLGILDADGAEGGAATRVREGLIRLGGSVDVEELRTQVEVRARANPLQMVLATFAAGFVIGRILR
jgi:rubrerythrin